MKYELLPKNEILKVVTEDEGILIVITNNDNKILIKGLDENDKCIMNHTIDKEKVLNYN